MSSENIGMATGPPTSKKSFRRASHACVKCRVRKVRCDVTIRGRPCMNCSLDGEECNIECTERARRRCRTQGLGKRKWSTGGPSVSNVSNGHRQHKHSVDPCGFEEGQPQIEPRGRDGSTRTVASSDSTTSPTLTDANPAQADGRYGERDTSTGYTILRCAGDYADRQEKTPPLIDDAVSSRYYIGYSYYRFLAADNISFIPARDYQFLQQEGCLHVPVRPILDVFVRQYFLHMHPMLPILDEGTFWDMYDQCLRTRNPRHTISLLIFQTMLFACCNFVPQKILNLIGFDTGRSARASFYRRAKLLYDLEADSSFIIKSQAALLLASWSFSSYEIPRKPNIPWLSVAIQHARDAGAHNYKEFSPDSEEYIVRKRLWWCCIIRDRLFGLGMRRSIQITATQFDVAHNSPLDHHDLMREVHRSRVHDVATKVQLANVFELLVQLCIILTDIVELAFPLEGNTIQSICKPEVQRRVRDSRIGLQKWHDKTLVQLTNPAMSSEECNQDDSVVLYTNLLYMYYYSTKAILGHCEILHIATSAASSTTQSASLKALERNHFELQDAALEVTRCLQKLADRGLIRLLPVTAVSCTALPLLLHILGIEVSSSIRVRDPRQLNLMAQRLDVLRTAMKTYQLQYEGVSWISESINRVVTIARAGLSFTDRGLTGPTSTIPQGLMGQERDSCVEMLTFQPGWYLRMAFSIDVALGKGRLPKDENFSRSFHELILAEIAPSDDNDPNRLWDAENALASISNVTEEQKDDEAVAAIYAAAPRQRTSPVAEPSYVITDITDSWGAHLFGISETERMEGNTGSKEGVGFTANTPSIAGDEGSSMTEIDIFTLLSREEFGSNEEFGLDLSPGGSTLGNRG